jgi:hypothetical protein
VGILAFLLHRRGHAGPLMQSRGTWNEPASIRHDMKDLYNDRRANRGMTR